VQGLDLHVMCVAVACVDAVPCWVGSFAMLFMCGDLKELSAVLTYT
jgi:hypothetical protein